MGPAPYKNTYSFLEKSLLVSNLKAASRCFNAGMFINDSSLYCLQANEMNIGYRKVRCSYYMEGIKICCLQHILLQVLNFKLQPPNFFHFWLRRNQACDSEMSVLTWVTFPKPIQNRSHANMLSDPKCLFS